MTPLPPGAKVVKLSPLDHQRLAGQTQQTVERLADEIYERVFSKAPTGAACDVMPIIQGLLGGLLAFAARGFGDDDHLKALLAENIEVILPQVRMSLTANVDQEGQG